MIAFLVALFALVFPSGGDIGEPAILYQYRMPGVASQAPIHPTAYQLRRIAENKAEPSADTPAPLSGASRPSEAVVAADFPVGACPAEIVAAFPGTEVAACRVAWCESGWNPNAIGAAGERGWFQIHPVHFKSIRAHWGSGAPIERPDVNLWKAVGLSRGGSDWTHWSVRNVVVTGYCPNGERAKPY